MSRLDAFFEGWAFRTNRPTFDQGEEITAFVTGFRDGAGVVRIGDTVLRVEGARADLVDTRVRLRVDEFDGNDHVGTATVLEELDRGAF